MRKYTLAIATLLTALGSIAPQSAIAQMIEGQIVRIDESAGKVTIKHGPIKKFDLDEGHTMVFRAQDPAVLKQVKVGEKIKFEADRINGEFTVIKIQK